MNDYNSHPRGSEWNKWDLHIHSPASFHWNGGKRLSEMTPIQKEAALKQMYDGIVNSDPVAFAIVDYWTFDGYQAFIQYIQDNRLELSKAVFPGIELRVEAPVNYRLNLQVVLSNDLSTQQLLDFKSQLQIRSIERQLSDEALAGFAKTLDESKARVHGYNPPEQLSELDLLELGSKTAEITRESLESAMSTVPLTQAFVVMPFSTSDGLKDLDWAKHPHADSYFMKMADIFESRDDATVELFTGIETDRNRSIFKNFQKTIGDIAKPVVCGSDAHKFSDYGAYPQNKVTWIKANPTFEGLKQIVFEPAERVKIQEECPAKKVPYLLIDKVAFRDSPAKARFPNDYIHINPDLNAIIGGKSSGKSLLLYHIAKTVEPSQVETKLKILSEAGYDFEDESDFDFEVVWNDGMKMKLKEDSQDKSRRITYIPQMYINHLAEEKGEEQLKRLIEDVLQQNEKYYTFLQDVKAVISGKNAEISQGINDLFILRENHAQLQQEIKEIGERKAIKQQLKTTESRIDELRRSSDFTKEDNEAYETLNKKKDFHDDHVRRYQAIRSTVASFCSFTTDSLIQSAKSDLEQAKEDALQSVVEDKLQNKLVGRLWRQKDAILQQFKRDYAEPDIRLLEAIDKRISRHSQASENVKTGLTPYLAKIKNQKFLKELLDLLRKEQEKLVKISEKEKRQAEIVERGKSVRASFLEAYSALHSAHQSIVTKLAAPPFNKIGVDLELKATLDFDTDRFAESFSALFDRRSNFNSVFGDCFDNNQYIYDQKNHNANIISIFDEVSRGEQANLRFRGDYTPRDAAFKLFDSYFNLRYTITQRDDDILRMSPGKRGLVLLQLILHLSNAEHPILIDQPEDNLDNRTIYNELNEFVKGKKSQRQILFVTHNANMTVAADAENVIVANQSGQDRGKDNRKFGFEYVTGGLEHTFRNSNANGILYQMGIREHVCDILEGGMEAFKKREKKYGFSK